MYVSSSSWLHSLHAAIILRVRCSFSAGTVANTPVDMLSEALDKEKRSSDTKARFVANVSHGKTSAIDLISLALIVFMFVRNSDAAHHHHRMDGRPAEFSASS